MEDRWYIARLEDRSLLGVSLDRALRAELSSDGSKETQVPTFTRSVLRFYSILPWDYSSGFLSLPLVPGSGFREGLAYSSA